jgi:branched-chain amino acid transport system permease protein
MPNKAQRFKLKILGFPHYFNNWIRDFKGGLTLACVLGLLAFPILTTNSYFLGLFILFMIYSIFAASWDLLAGFTGKVSFGHAIFLGISGYVTAELLKFFNFNWIIALLFGILITVLIGLGLGYLTLRLKGPYLALGTLVIGIICQQVFALGPLKPILHGDEGISGLPPISNNTVVIYYIVLIFMIISFITLIRITKLNIGTIFKSIRDDEVGSEAAGINITKYKVIAFMISGAFAGLAGGLFTMFNRSVNPLIFQPLFSFYAIIIAALGGLGTISGSAIGAFLFEFLGAFFVGLTQINLLIFSIILIIIIRFASGGVLKPALERLKEFWDILLGR